MKNILKKGMIVVGKYETRINLYGLSQRERELNRLKNDILKTSRQTLSFKNVLINNIERNLIIDTGNQTYIKEFKTLPNEVIFVGDIVDWTNNKWLVLSADSDDEIYIDGIMQQCNYVLKWQDETNKIIERNIVSKDNSGNGEKDDKEFIISENQLSILIPFDTDTVELKEGKRFFVDNNPIKKSVYRLTKIDNTSHVLNGKGYISLVVTKDQFNDSVDRSDLELCDYTIPSPVTTIPTENHIKLDFKTTSLYVGGNYKTVTATVVNTDGNVVLTSGFTWEVTSDISTKVVTSIDENVFKIKVIEDMDIIGKVIVVTAKNGTYEEQLKFEVKG